MAQMQELHHANTEASTAENSGGSAVDKKRPIGFLDLPAEIRNRIYYYADERAHRLLPDDFDAERYIPSIMRYAPGNPGPWPIDDYAKSSLKFLGFTEVCRKVRSEYNPIWKATAEFRIRYEDFGLFTQTSSFTKDQEAGTGPKLLQVSWDRETEAISLDLLPFLKLRINHPETEVQFVHQRSVNRILAHDNELWKAEIRAGAVTEVTADVPGYKPRSLRSSAVLHITFAEQVRSTSRDTLDNHQASASSLDRTYTCLREHGHNMGLGDFKRGVWDSIICVGFPCVVDGTRAIPAFWSFLSP